MNLFSTIWLTRSEGHQPYGTIQHSIDELGNSCNDSVIMMAP